MNPLPPHLQRSQYGEFTLTKAIRPGPTVPIIPMEGYRTSRYRDPDSKRVLPMLGAAVSAEKLFQVFLDLLEPLSDRVHVVLETSHESENNQHMDLRRGEIDAPVLMSHFCDFEDLLCNDGCTGVAVVAVGRPIEVQFDEHKLLFVYAPDLRPFKQILDSYGVPLKDDLRLIAEGPHLHHSSSEYLEEFLQLATRVGAADYDSVLTDDDNDIADSCW